MDSLIAEFGYLFVFLVAAIEGEGALAAGALLAQEGEMSYGGAVAASFLGSLAIGEGMFHLARRRGRAWLLTKVTAERLAPLERWLVKRGGLLVLASRFLWGVRVWIPAVCGVGGMSAKRFFVWNVSGAALWTAVFAPIAYYFGEAIRVLPPAARNWMLLGIVILTGAVVVSVVRAARRGAGE